MDHTVQTAWPRIKAKAESLRWKKRVSFITIHYLYMLGMTITGSILLYPGSGIAYIDALFFAAGACTQSGLNTININDMTTYQQVVLYFLAQFTNVVTINTFIVFVRLYWFEKRFQHVVKEAMAWRRTRSRSRTNTQGLEERGEAAEKRGVDGRNIMVFDSTGMRLGSESEQQQQGKAANDPESSSDSSEDRNVVANLDGGAMQLTGQPPQLTRNITFADNVASPTNRSPNDRIPQKLSPEQNIAFLEKQRNLRNNEILRIPGPRESDLGQVPEQLHDANLPMSPDGEGQDRHITFPNLEPTRTRSTMPGLHLPRTVTSRSQGASSALERAPSAYRLRRNSGTFSRFNRTATGQTEAPYLSWQPTIGRNSAFVDLTEDQREELGGIEYRSLKLLAIILVSYFLGWHLIGIVNFTPWILRTEPWGSIVDGDGINRVWWGIFTPATCFNDLGFTLTPDSMASFQSAVWILLLGSFLIVIGNTGFPCLLRFTIWLSSQVVPRASAVWEELQFLLDHPRRCFTLMFPSTATWVLFGILIILNGLDLIFFIVLDLNDPVVTGLSPGLQFLNGLFQAVSTRTSGTAVVNLSLLHPAIQVSYLIMMYISVFPIAISVRRTNVYEEKSLGIYGSNHDEDEDSKEPSYVGAHLRRQLSFDLWFIFLGLFIISIAEGDQLRNDPNFSVFACLFEIVSAYGTVGLSLGYPTNNMSLSAEFGVVSKLVIIAMMLRGRHRGLPYDLDRAVLLPSESLHQKEDEDAAKRAGRGMSNLTEADIRRAAAEGAFDGVLDGDGLSPRPLSTTRSHPLSPGSQASHLAAHPTQSLGEALAGVARSLSRKKD